MTRRRVGDPEIKPLIEAVATLVLEQGSVNRAQEALAAGLAADGSEGIIYPNRLHALLSEDPGKSLNPSTLRTIETAVERVGVQRGQIPADAEELRRDAIDRWPGTEVAFPGGGYLDRVRHLAGELRVPPAVVSLLLGGRSDEEGVTGRPEPALPSTREPDWSYQGTACERCLRALAEGPNKKIGLVLPTGGGKTRVAIRILLRALNQSELEDPIVIWVTHRTRLRLQAARELQRAVTHGTPDVPADAAALLAERVEFCMLAKLPETLDRNRGRIALVVVDEAHHAAADSYRPLFAESQLRGLFLTATPNRTDLLPIGIDEIAYSATFRELFDRGVILEPDLDELTLDGFQWNSTERVAELADYLLSEAQDRFGKTLVAVARVEHGESLYDALVETLTVDHLLDEEDVGLVHGSANSRGLSTQDFLDEFQARPRGILIATTQLLGEGFDDPAVDTAVVTYETQSMLDLMQVAGRCMRYAPGKRHANVIQVRDSALAYHWEQGWLYQDISDILRPRLDRVSFTSREDLVARLETIIADHNVSSPVRGAVLAAASSPVVEQGCSLLLTGLPYSGPKNRFDRDANWGAILITAEERDVFLRVFNSYSALGEEVNDKPAFLRQFIPFSREPGGRWRRYMDLLAAMDRAAADLSGQGHALDSSRPSAGDKGTSWLTYTTFSFEPEIPADLEEFLADAINRDEIVGRYAERPEHWRLVLKVPLPLGGSQAALYAEEARAWIEGERNSLRAQLVSEGQRDGFKQIAVWRTGVGADAPLPQFMLDRFEQLLGNEGWERLSLTLA